MRAANSSHVEVVKYLIESCGANINTKDNVSSDDMSIYYNSITIITGMDVIIIYSMDELQYRGSEISHRYRSCW